MKSLIEFLVWPTSLSNSPPVVFLVPLDCSGVYAEVTLLYPVCSSWPDDEYRENELCNWMETLNEISADGRGFFSSTVVFAAIRMSQVSDLVS